MSIDWTKDEDDRMYATVGDVSIEAIRLGEWSMFAKLEYWDYDGPWTLRHELHVSRNSIDELGLDAAAKECVERLTKTKGAISATRTRPRPTRPVSRLRRAARG
jgi:hypothetical protein